MRSGFTWGKIAAWPSRERRPTTPLAVMRGLITAAGAEMVFAHVERMICCEEMCPFLGGFETKLKANHRRCKEHIKQTLLQEFRVQWSV